MREVWKWMPEDDVIPCVGTRKQRLEAFRELWEDAAKTGRRTWFICNIEMTRTQFEASCPGPTKKEIREAIEEERELDEACDGELAWCAYQKRHKSLINHNWPELFQATWQAVVLDESHKALITTKSRRKKQSQTRVGFGMLPIVDGGLRIALSGTPWRGKAENFWGTLNWLRPDLYSAFWPWGTRYFDTENDGFGIKIGSLKPEMEDDWHRDLRSVMIRRTKREVAKDLPPKHYAGTPLIPDDPTSLWGIWLPLLPEQEKVYKAMQRDAIAHLEGGTMYGKGVLAGMTRLRQFATSCGIMVPTGKFDAAGDPELRFKPTMPSNKFDWLLDFLDERGIAKDDWGDSKVVVASQSTEIINLFRAELAFKGIATHGITGQTKRQDRLRQVEEFQSPGGPRVFFINTDAGGVSITLDAADDIVFLDEKWVPDDQEQVEDRIHRISRIHQVTVYYLRSLGTIEEQIGLVTTRRDFIQKKLLDGARGVKFARQLISIGI
jgi:SNF2 family DNA or RNA helicase